MDNQGWIYRLHSDIDGDERFYIGSTDNLEIRMKEYEENEIIISKTVKEWFYEINDDWNYTILTYFEDITKEDLVKAEDDEIVKYLKKDENCLNQRRAFLTEEERKD